MRPRTCPLLKGSSVGLLVLLAFIVATPQEALAYYQDTPEPPPRPTPTAAPYIEVTPTEGVAEQDFSLTVRGSFWPATAGGITLYWDGQHLSGPHPVDPSGGFQIDAVVPAAWASVGVHTVGASHNLGYSAQVNVLLIQPTPTPTFTPSPTPTPTNTHTPSPTPTPITPTPTPTRTPTQTPSPTLAPLTPIVTQTPYSKPTKWPTQYPTLPPLPTQTPLPLTPSPTPSPGPIALVTDTPTPTPTDTPTPTPTDTPTPTPTDTPTDTPTPSPTPVPPQGAAVPTATAQQVSLVPFSNQPGLPYAGTNWEASFATGFIVAIWVIVLLIAFLVTVLIVLLVVWRLFVKRQTQRS